MSQLEAGLEQFLEISWMSQLAAGAQRFDWELMAISSSLVEAGPGWRRTKAPSLMEGGLPIGLGA